MGVGKCQWQRLKRMTRARRSSLRVGFYPTGHGGHSRGVRRHEKETSLQGQEEEEGIWRDFKQLQCSCLPAVWTWVGRGVSPTKPCLPGT